MITYSVASICQNKRNFVSRKRNIEKGNHQSARTRKTYNGQLVSGKQHLTVSSQRPRVRILESLSANIAKISAIFNFPLKTNKPFCSSH